MKTSSIIIASASLFAALGLAVPVPASSETVQVVVKTGDGDSAVGLTVPLNQLFSTAKNPGASAGVAATIDDPTATCQAFSDNAGRTTLGTPFKADTPASFSTTSSGGTESNIHDAVPIGAFLCVKPADVSPNAGGSNLPSKASARVELETESDEFIQIDLPVDGSIYQIHTTGLNLSIVAATDVDVNRVSCQAFTDFAAQHSVGGHATLAYEAILTADSNQSESVTINAIVCSA